MQLQDALELARDVVRSPLASVVDTLANSPDDTVAVYQALLEPHDDWTVYEGLRREDIEWVEDTYWQQLSWFFRHDTENPDEENLPKGNRRRLDDLEVANPKKSWTVNARAYVQGLDADAITRGLADAFGSLDGDFYWVDPDGDDAHDVLEDIHDRTFRIDYDQLRRLDKRLPSYPNTKSAVITDLIRVPPFCFLDGDAFTQPDGRRWARRPVRRRASYDSQTSSLSCTTRPA